MGGPLLGNSNVNKQVMMSLTKRHVGGGLQSNKWLPNVSHHHENTRKSRPGGNGSKRQGGQ